MRVISTERSQILAARIAGALNTTVVDVKFTRFPDGEQYLCADKPDDEMIIVGSIVDNDALVQLLLLIDACDCATNRLVIPYMGYARQDKRFHDGEPISARAIARTLGRGVESCITVNIHEREVLKYFDVPTTNLTLARDIGEYIESAALDDPLILAPDEGALDFARDVASAGNWDFDNLEKTRLSGVEVKMAPKKVCAASRSVVIVDDIISTGGTIATAAGMLYKEGAEQVYAACVHGVLIGGAYVHLKANGIRDIVCSDTIERACSQISAATRIADALR
ncbi:MAG: ribose-phosphate diphosphokinase [Methanoregula sp.]|jgi:ribose-phosphate pyrophosphokinase|nr:ribose-phosphate diphosphokinase [Methanoregula sp.]MDD5024749.1 ribose-phosphate diphosphokinase [Methanoregula sp.]MDD5187552.1 ribose-phosphate diphosphokinase [Methanoregula sp.]